jgi:hypothetical protein
MTKPAVPTKALVVMPVRDSLSQCQQSIKAFRQHYDMPLWVYDDNSQEQTREWLQAHQTLFQYTLFTVSALTPNPPPNYGFVLRHVLQNVHTVFTDPVAIILLESDVQILHAHTLPALLQHIQLPEMAPSLVAAATIDTLGQVNYPYHRQRVALHKKPILSLRHVSFCCTVLSPLLCEKLQKAKWPRRTWYDLWVSSFCRHKGGMVLLDATYPVRHSPHSSRPWKQKKYINPISYYIKRWFHKHLYP